MNSPSENKENVLPPSLKRPASVISAPGPLKRTIIQEMRSRVSADPVLARQILEGLDYEEVGWCRLSTLKPTKKNGYIQLSWGGANKFACLQEVVLWAGGGRLLPGEQCSHLCGRPACLGLDHIIAESELENQRRKGCHVWVDCPHCDLKIPCCGHGQKKCIKYCVGFAGAADFEARGLH